MEKRNTKSDSEEEGGGGEERLLLYFKSGGVSRKEGRKEDLELDNNTERIARAPLFRAFPFLLLLLLGLVGGRNGHESTLSANSDSLSSFCLFRSPSLSLTPFCIIPPTSFDTFPLINSVCTEREGSIF